MENMEKIKTRHTYLSTAEFIQRAAERCREAEMGLRTHLSEAGEADMMALKSVADAEHLLACALERYVDSGPKEVLKTGIQYQMDSSIESKLDPRSLDEAIAQLTRLNMDLSRSFRDQASKAGTLHMSEAMDNISTEIDAISRRISMIRVTARDL
jgi:hypothetical protein